jgi:hypothetical protein
MFYLHKQQSLRASSSFGLAVALILCPGTGYAGSGSIGTLHTSSGGAGGPSMGGSGGTNLSPHGSTGGSFHGIGAESPTHVPQSPAGPANALPKPVEVQRVPATSGQPKGDLESAAGEIQRANASLSKQNPQFKLPAGPSEHPSAPATEGSASFQPERSIPASEQRGAVTASPQRTFVTKQQSATSEAADGIADGQLGADGEAAERASTGIASALRDHAAGALKLAAMAAIAIWMVRVRRRPKYPHAKTV